MLSIKDFIERCTSIPSLALLWLAPFSLVGVFMSRMVLPAGHYVSELSVLPSVRPSFRPLRFRGTTLRAAPSKNYAFSTNYHAYIAMPT